GGASRRRRHRRRGDRRGARALVYAVLHDQAARHRPRGGDRAVGRLRPRPARGGRPRPGPRGPLPPGAARLARVLLVDDQQSTLASLSRAFRLAGYEAVVCDNATRAISLLQQERFDLVFSDVVMPGKDGLSMLADLREMGVTTPIIMISGQATVDMAVRATR